MSAQACCMLGAPRATRHAAVPLRRRAPPPRAAPVRPCAMAAQTSAPSAPSGAKLKPDWAGSDDLLSRVVNAAIATPGLYDVMKVLARQTLISTAEKNGIPWREEVKRFETDPRFQAEAARLTDARVAYPDYYLKPFHAYSEGNLNWLAAFEAESATYSMALRVWPAEVKAGQLSWRDAQARLRDSFTDALRAYAKQHGARLLQPGAEALDVGCSVGISTRALCAAFPEAKRVTGLDLSPYMLSVASLRDQQEAGARSGPERAWVHGLAEATGREDASVDLYAASFLFHELPQDATAAVLAEAFRVLRPGGVFALTDNNPRSEVIQKLPPALFTLMKSTEPHSDEYYVLDTEAAMRAAGFEQVVTVPTDPRHRTVLGLKR